MTSPGFGGRPVNGPAGERHLARSSWLRSQRAASLHAPNVPRNGDGIIAAVTHISTTPAPGSMASPVPYAVDLGATDAGNDADADADDDDPNYQGGPTIFDRRGSGAASYVPPVSTFPRLTPFRMPMSPPADPDPPQAPTLLVFKDGHKLELGNYAIIGATLFDLTPGTRPQSRSRRPRSRSHPQAERRSRRHLSAPATAQAN